MDCDKRGVRVEGLSFVAACGRGVVEETSPVSGLLLAVFLGRSITTSIRLCGALPDDVGVEVLPASNGERSRGVSSSPTLGDLRLRGLGEALLLAGGARESLSRVQEEAEWRGGVGSGRGRMRVRVTGRSAVPV